MIDNFELIKPLFYFNEESYMFFHCQIVRRAKGHKPDKVKEKTIQTYFIRSIKHLNSLKEEIILLCEHYGARAYINVAGKDFDSVNKSMLAMLANAVCLKSIAAMNPERILNRCVGEEKSRIPKWVIDIDDMSIKDGVLEWLDNYFRSIRPSNILNSNYNFYLYAEIPTVQGCHLIVSPFDYSEFSEAFPNVDVHKNSMGTLLYYPKSLS